MLYFQKKKKKYSVNALIYFVTGFYIKGISQQKQLEKISLVKIFLYNLITKISAINIYFFHVKDKMVIMCFPGQFFVIIELLKILK